MKTDAYEIYRLRQQFALRGHRPRNRRRHLPADAIVGYGLVATALIVPAIAAAIIILL